MTTQKFNRIQILYNAEHKPYLYGAVHRVDGDLSNQRWENPFVISKQRPSGEEVVYGTVKRTLEKIKAQLERLKRFQLETQAKLDTAGITPLIGEDSILHESEVAESILDEQEDLLEDVLLTVSVNIRILSEIFLKKLKKSKIAVYDYQDRQVSTIETSGIADLLVHNRYIVVKDRHVVDLVSDKKFLSKRPQVGLKIDILSRSARNA